MHVEVDSQPHLHTLKTLPGYSAPVLTVGCTNNLSSRGTVYADTGRAIYPYITDPGSVSGTGLRLTHGSLTRAMAHEPRKV